MKIKKIKLLKALALTGAFGIVATVPVIVSSCSSTSDNNNGNGNNNNGGGSDGNTQSEKITPELNDKVSLAGSLKDIYDSTGTKKSNELIAEEIKNNIKDVFKNGEKLAAETDLKITVDGGFPEKLTNWTDLPYVDNTDDASKKDPNKSWSAITDLNPVLYSTKSNQINIKSLDDLKTELQKTDVLKNALKDAGVSTAETSTAFEIKNQPALTNDDLVHVNVIETKSDKSTVQHDLQIPTSDINLVVSNLSVKVEGKNIESTDTTKTTTEFNFNIGIDSTQHYDQGSAKSAATTEGDVDVNKVLKDLNLATDDKGALNNEALIKALGIYNVTFSSPSIKKATVTARAATATSYEITLKATPNKEGNNTYVWDDGTTEAKDITFPVTIDIGS
ncbi:P35 lipoprotein homolog reported as putative lipoprotein IMP13 [Malacoplasma penetrans HF-2]|uniref:Lipoprotein P42 n=3 Tax=Malacoplasma penetrans TaxID=28227 RepID=Q7DGH8_MALPE|nr:P35 family lipoprotein [Malacoplasma penetrans]BAC44455.1 P35 lipoprotein homolog reported as putative lipoprotein IMP13 [Malacoplasma penetrans HF-2]BAC45034.1 lipoprotein P42 [Malacoplasma penetrans]